MRKLSIFIVLSLVVSSVFGQMSTGTFDVKHIENNTKGSDYVTFLNKDKVIFVSPVNERKRKGASGLFTGKVNNEGEIIGKELISDFSKNKISKTGLTYTKGLDAVYFSSNNLRKVYSKTKEYRRRRRRVNNKKSQIFKATVQADGSWSNIESLSFNKKRYTYENPTLSNDGKQLYFVSNNKKTSLGGKDIYVVDIKADGSFGIPQNLGATINTKGDEVTPFITKDNKLYFSSNGQEDTFGNLDVYVSNLGSGNPTVPLHLNESINSEKDDFAFIINNGNTKGFISSNREAKNKNNDIYYFTAEGLTSQPCVQEIAGVVRDSETKEIINEATITLFDEANNEIDQVKTDEEGLYRFSLDCDKTYNLTAFEQAYKIEEYAITTNEYYNEPTIEADKLLVKKTENKDDIESLNDINSTINLIYFGFDKSNITQESKTELDKIVEILENNKNIQVEVAAYTDARGDNAYNLTLSERRANAALEYLVAKGVDSNRIVANGYGESKLINKCNDEVACSEAAHKENRRIEFSFTNSLSNQQNKK